MRTRHFSDRWLAPKMQGLVHVALIVAALLLLRVLPSDAWKPQDSSYPAFRILGLLAISVGLPYFVLSSTGPLLQAWFARSFPEECPIDCTHCRTWDRCLALLSYPFWFERWFDIPDQAKYWSWGFVAYAVLCGYAAISVWLSAHKAAVGIGGAVPQEPGVRSQESGVGSSFSRDPRGSRKHHQVCSTASSGSRCRPLPPSCCWPPQTTFRPTLRRCLSVGRAAVALSRDVHHRFRSSSLVLASRRFHFHAAGRVCSGNGILGGPTSLGS